MLYFLHILTLVCIYTILAVSLDLLAGHTGILSVAQAAFYGVGAYTSALLAVRVGCTFLESALAGVFAASVVSFMVSLPSLRLHDDYFVIATFAFQIIIFSFFNNSMPLTNGPLGIPGIPQPAIGGWTVRTHMQFFIFAAVIAALAYAVVSRLATSPFGRVLHAIREDEVFIRSLGKDTLRFKVVAFAVSAALAAFAGSLYAHYITYIDPTSFTVTESILVISMVIIGGPASRWGPVIGATILVITPEVLRFVGLPNSVAASLRQVIYGALLVIMMTFRPRGLVGRYGFMRR